MKTVNVELRTEYFECDCCDFYSNDIVKVLIQSADQEVIVDTELYNDGHLGLGDWNGTRHSLYCYLITFLNGYTKYIFDTNEYTEESGRDDHSKPLVISVKHSETSASVQFNKYFYLTDFQSYETKDFRDEHHSLEENLLKWALDQFCSEMDIEYKIINKV